MADNSLWLAISSILHVFTITPAKDKDGKEIPVDVVFTSGLISCVFYFAVMGNSQFLQSAGTFQVLYYASIRACNKFDSGG